MTFSNFKLISIISLIYLYSFKIDCIFIFPFDTIFIKNPTAEKKDYFTNLTQNELFINFSIGSNEEIIYGILKMDKNGFLIYENAYNYNHSETYEKLIPDYEENLETNWVQGCEQIPSRDNLSVPIYNSQKNKYEIIKTNKLRFLRLKQKENKNIFFNTMFYTYAILGLKYNYNSYFKTPEFVKELKNSENINKNIFYLTFDKSTKKGFAINNNKGKLFIGKELDENNTIYSPCLSYIGELLWGLEFDKIYTKNNNENKKVLENIKLKAQLVGTYPYIKAPFEFFEYLNKYFFMDLLEKNICKRINFTRHDIYLDYNFYSYACNSESKIFMENLNNNFPDIIFEHKTFNEFFTLTKNDLFAFNNFDNNDNNLYFLMVSGNDYTEWLLGIPFLKKYVFSYDYDSKTVGYYADFGKEKNNDENDNNFLKSITFKVIIIILLVIVVFILGMFFQKNYKKKRKIKANELDDDFDYEPQKDKIEDTNNNDIDNNINENNKNNDRNEILGINE